MIRLRTGGMLLVIAALWAGGCAATSLAPADMSPEDLRLFGPPVPQPGFDAHRAAVPFALLPGDVPDPAEARAVADPELPRQALQHLAQARQLFAAARYEDAVRSAEQALGYNASIHEAHRLIALACLLSGQEQRARLAAERCLALRPRDVACHYLLGRLAHKAEDFPAAVTAYRVALKCHRPGLDDDYMLLTRFHLGALLEAGGYLQAAIDVWELLARTADRLETTPEANPELAAVRTGQLASMFARIARAHDLLGRPSAAAGAMAEAVRRAPTDIEWGRQYTAMLVRAGRSDQAMAEAERILEVSGRSPESGAFLLATARVTGRAARAADVLGRVSAARPDDTPAAMLHAEALIAAGRYAEAATILSRVAAREPEASWKLLEIRRRRGDWEGWSEALSEELALRPASLPRADDEIAGVPPAALRRMADVVLRAPADGDRVRNAARACLQGLIHDRLDRPDDALASFRAARSADGGFVPAALGEARLHVRRCAWAAALAVLGGIETADPPVRRLALLLSARSHDGLDDIPAAVRDYLAAIQLAPEDADTRVDLGRLYERVGRTEDAREQYQAAVSANPEHVAARERLIRNLWTRWRDRGVLRKLSAELAELQRLAPQDPATIRCTALARFLIVQEADLHGYVQTLQTLIRLRPDDFRSREDLAEALALLRDDEGARREVEAILKIEPYHPQANEMLAALLVRMLALDEVQAHLERVLRWYPNREGLLRTRAEILLIQGRTDEASRLWQHLLSRPETGERHPAYRARLLYTWARAGRHDLAVATAQEWVEQAEGDAAHAARLQLLSALTAADRLDDYIARCREWLLQDPDNRRYRAWLAGGTPEEGGLSGRAAGLIGAGRHDEAVLEAMGWLKADPSDGQAIAILTGALQAAGRHEEVLEILRSRVAASTGPADRIDRVQELIQACIAAGRFDEAVAAARGIRPDGAEDNADLETVLGQLLATVLVQAGRYDESADQLRRIVADLEERQARLREILADPQNERLGPQLRAELVNLRGRKSRLLRSLSFVFQSQNRPDLAEEHLREAYELAPTSVDLNNDYGYTLADAGRNLEAAERMIRMAAAEVLTPGLGEDSRQAAFLDSLGWVLYKLSRHQEAAFWLELAVSLEPEPDPVMLDHLGDVYWRLERREQARASWKKAAEILDRREPGRVRPPEEAVRRRLESKLEAVAGGRAPQVAPVGEHGGPKA